MEILEYKIYAGPSYANTEPLVLLPDTTTYLPSNCFFEDKQGRPYEYYKNLNKQYRELDFQLHRVITDDAYFAYSKIEQPGCIQTVGSIICNNTQVLSKHLTKYEFTDLSIKIGDTIGIRNDNNYIFIFHVKTKVI